MVKKQKTLWMMNLTAGKLTLSEVEILKETEKQYQLDSSLTVSRVLKDNVDRLPISVYINARFYSSRNVAIAMWKEAYTDRALRIKEVLLQLRELAK